MSEKIRELNKLQWSGKTGLNHYEGWYITLIDPATGTGFWFRYTILIPVDGRAPSASLWAFSFDPNAPEMSAQGRDDYPLSVFDQNSKGLTIDQAILTDNAASGTVETNQGLMSWDLKFQESLLSWQHFDPKFFNIGLSQTCVNSPRLNVPISGTIQLGDRLFTLDSVQGEQSHIWGRRPTTHYAWAHCNDFEEDKTSVFEGLNARIEKGSYFLPAAGPLLFCVGEERFEVRSFFKMFQIRSEQGFGFWEFEGESGSTLLKGRVDVDPAHVVAVEYDDPGGDRRVFCHNSIVADMTITLYRKTRAMWEPVLTRFSKGTTSFEITRVERDPRVQRILRLADGRQLGSLADLAISPS
jgi:hypothetical protein